MLSERNQVQSAQRYGRALGKHDQVLRRNQQVHSKCASMRGRSVRSLLRRGIAVSNTCNCFSYAAVQHDYVRCNSLRQVKEASHFSQPRFPAVAT